MKKRIFDVFGRVNRHRREKPLLFWTRTAVILAVASVFIFQRSFWTPDTLFILLLAVFFVIGQAKAFIFRFLPFIVLLLIYDSFRAIADDLSTYVNFWEMIVFDEFVFFGFLPNNFMQDFLWHGGLNWYDFYFYFLYTIHFVAPVALAVLIWKTRDRLYWPYVSSLVLLSFAAFITYIIFPAAPPWMASDLGYIDPIHRISSDIWHAMGIQDFSTVYNNLSPNLVAAVPSLHSAYPMLFALFLFKLFSFRKVWWVLIYPVSMWIGVVYLGEHYVFDALLGALYAVAAYLLTFRVFAWKEKRNFNLEKKAKKVFKKSSKFIKKLLLRDN